MQQNVMPEPTQYTLLRVFSGILFSPDLSPCDYNLISKLKKYLHTKQFSNKKNYFNSDLV